MSLIWLSLLVVMAEFLIVVLRFIYGYEQTFMGDLVRFWYAALFLFASAYTLKEDAHVRVDVIYAGLRRKTKCILNSTGCFFFGIPLCWLIIVRGLWGKSSLINSPMLNFETSMSGFGMYIKYLMAAFLLVFALSMLLQFTSYLFNSLADLTEASPEKDSPKRWQHNGTVFSRNIICFDDVCIGSGFPVAFAFPARNCNNCLQDRSIFEGDSGAYFIQDGPSSG